MFVLLYWILKLFFLIIVVVLVVVSNDFGGSRDLEARAFLVFILFLVCFICS